MSDENDKGMLNEILPDPTRGAEDLADGLPRRRTADHLRKILAAGLALQLASDIAGCSSPAPTPPKPPAMAPPGQQPNTRNPPAPPWLPPNGPGYGVVDMLPNPSLLPLGGFLSLTSTPVARITIDGRETGLDTPQAAIPLRPGRHRIRLDVPAEQMSRTFEVEIASGETLIEDRDLRKMPPGPPKK
jgi:hypothetical protein